MAEEKRFAEVEDTEDGPRISVNGKTFEVIGTVFSIRDHLNTAHASSLEEFRKRCMEAVKNEWMQNMLAAETSDTERARGYKVAIEEALKAISEVPL